MIHHLAILTPDAHVLSSFYKMLLDVSTDREQRDDAGLRSVWLRAGGSLLMIEREAAAGPGRHVLVFATAPGSLAAAEARLAAAGARPEGPGGAYLRTRFTIYGRDPDGNRVGLSSWPEPLEQEPLAPLTGTSFGG